MRMQFCGQRVVGVIGTGCAAALVGLLLWAATATVYAENFDVYPFESTQEEARFEALLAELRCPKCQNQSIADSNAPIAQDLRARTYELVRAGRSDAEIITYLTERYGEFIRYRPAFNALTAVLWLGPLLLLLVVGAVLLVRLRRQGVLRAQAADAAADAEKVSAILRRFDETERLP